MGHTGRSRVRVSGRTWLMCTAGMEAADTAEWLGELGRDLQGPIASCCFFRKATTFWATAGDSRINYTHWGEGRKPSSAPPCQTQPCLPGDLPAPPLRGPSYRPGRRAPR